MTGRTPRVSFRFKLKMMTISCHSGLTAVEIYGSIRDGSMVGAYCRACMRFTMIEKAGTFGKMHLRPGPSHFLQEIRRGNISIPGRATG